MASSTTIICNNFLYKSKIFLSRRVIIENEYTFKNYYTNVSIHISDGLKIKWDDIFDIHNTQDMSYFLLSKIVYSSELFDSTNLAIHPATTLLKEKQH